MRFSRALNFGVEHRGWLFPAGLAAFLLGIFLSLSSELREGELEKFDQGLLRLVVENRHSVFNGPAVDITALGSVTVLTLLGLIALVQFFLFRDRWGGIILVLGSLGSIPLTIFAKHWISRPRPAVEHLVEVAGFSYPSGHSLGAASFYLLLTLLLLRHLPTWSARFALVFSAIFLVSLIGFSRIYLGVHYPTDVLSGLLCGAGWACLVASASAFFRRKFLLSN